MKKQRSEKKTLGLNQKKILFLILVILMEIACISLNTASADNPVEIQSSSTFDFQPLSSPLGDSLCLGVKFSQGEPISNLANLTELKVKWVREELPWNVLEPQPGQWRTGFPVSFLERLKFYREHDIGIIFLLGYGNQIAYPNDALNPANAIDPKRFADWAVHIAKLLKFSQVRFVLEILNEPHNQLPKMLGGNWQGAKPSPWVDHYVRLTHETVAAVHAYDPNIQLLTDDDMWIVHYWFLEAGLPADISGFAIHPYTPGIPEKTAVKHDTDWTRPFTVVDPDGSFRSAVRRLRDQGKSKLGKIPNIWITEWGWAVDGVKFSVTDATLTNYLPRAFILAASAGVRTTCWFSSQDAVDGPMGLTRNNGSRRDSFYAYRTLAEQLSDYKLIRHLFGSDHPTTGIQGYLFESGYDRKLVVWNVEGDEKSMNFPNDKHTGKAVDAMGKPISIAEKYPGKGNINISAQPIYISGGFLVNPDEIQFSDGQPAQAKP